MKRKRRQHPVFGVRLDPALARRLRVLAASRGVPIQTLVAALVEDALRRRVASG